MLYIELGIVEHIDRHYEAAADFIRPVALSSEWKDLMDVSDLDACVVEVKAALASSVAVDAAQSRQASLLSGDLSSTNLTARVNGVTSLSLAGQVRSLFPFSLAVYISLGFCVHHADAALVSSLSNLLDGLLRLQLRGMAAGCRV